MSYMLKDRIQAYSLKNSRFANSQRIIHHSRSFWLLTQMQLRSSKQNTSKYPWKRLLTRECPHCLREGIQCLNKALKTFQSFSNDMCCYFDIHKDVIKMISTLCFRSFYNLSWIYPAQFEQVVNTKPLLAKN